MTAGTRAIVLLEVIQCKESLMDPRSSEGGAPCSESGLGCPTLEEGNEQNVSDTSRLSATARLFLPGVAEPHTCLAAFNPST